MKKWLALGFAATLLTQIAPAAQAATVQNNKVTLTRIAQMAKKGQLISGTSVHVGSTRRDFVKALGAPDDIVLIGNGKTDMFVFHKAGVTYDAYFRAIPAKDRQDTYADSYAAARNAWGISADPTKLLGKGTTPDAVEKIIGKGKHTAGSTYMLTYREGNYDLVFYAKSHSQPLTGLLVKTH